MIINFPNRSRSKSVGLCECCPAMTCTSVVLENVAVAQTTVLLLWCWVKLKRFHFLCVPKAEWGVITSQIPKATAAAAACLNLFHKETITFPSPLFRKNDTITIWNSYNGWEPKFYQKTKIMDKVYPKSFAQ